MDIDVLVKLWDMPVGVVAWDRDNDIGNFEYFPEFLSSGLEVSPIFMPLSQGAQVFRFGNISRHTFLGLPGMLADSLPDSFGNDLLNVWLETQGKTILGLSSTERLCYTGTRGVGALEFEPTLGEGLDSAARIEVAGLVRVAGMVLSEREKLQSLATDEAARALLDVIRVGTSAGGARAKAVVAVDERMTEWRSGQVAAPSGFSHWLIKLDGVDGRRLGDPEGYGRIEYAYYKMATDAGITMQECRLFEEGSRAHFMTRRFDRPTHDTKLHIQTICGLAHRDYRTPAGNSYEQCFAVLRRLNLPYSSREQLYTQMVFNVVARNQDDHTKNISLIMDRQGRWSLAPGYDISYSYNPAGEWTARHQMSINGKRTDITRADLLTVGTEQGIAAPHQIIDKVVAAVGRWPEVARDCGVATDQIDKIGTVHRLEIGLGRTGRGYVNKEMS